MTIYTIKTTLTFNVDSEKEALYQAKELEKWVCYGFLDDKPELSIEGFKWAFPDEGRIGEPVKPTRKPKCRKVTIQLDFDSDSDAEALYEAYAIINGEASKNSSLVAWYAETEDKTVRLTPVKPTRKPSFHKINVEISLDEETEQEALYEVHSTLDSFTTATCGESHFTAIFFPEWGRIGDPVEPKRYRHVA